MQSNGSCRHPGQAGGGGGGAVPVLLVLSLRTLPEIRRIPRGPAGNSNTSALWFNRGMGLKIQAVYLGYFLQCALSDYARGKA